MGTTKSSATRLAPLADRLVVVPSDPEVATASGLVIPDSAQERPNQGTVLAVGPGRRSEETGELVPVGIESGATVIYAKYGGTELTIDGQDLLIISASDVLATMGAEPQSRK
jgi:chaperonin GroES